MAQRTSQANRTKQNNPPRLPAQLTFLDHFYELRKRLFLTALTLTIATVVGLEIKDQLIDIVVAPLKGAKLVYLTPGGGFSFIFTLSLYFGALLTIPVATYHIYRFLQPMMKATSRRFVVTFVLVSVLLAVLGASLAYFLAIPSALTFLNDVAGNTIVPNLTADSYLNFVISYTVGLAALFQLPLLIFLFDHIKPFPPGTLLKSQRYGIVTSTILAGFITPSPDLINYSIVLFPILGAYELGVLAVFLRRKLLRREKTVISEEAVKIEQMVEQPITEPANEPLTAIVEELTKEADMETDERPQVQVEQQPVVEAVGETLMQKPTIPARRRSVIGHSSATMPPVQNTQTVIVPANVATTPVSVTPKPQHAAGGRNIDGFYRADPHAAASLHVTSQKMSQAPSTQQKPQRKSIDGFLTAQA